MPKGDNAVAGFYRSNHRHFDYIPHHDGADICTVQ
jgi:hypothetical protein